MDLISVIIPVYQVEAYLKQCIDSVISQSYKNLEIILVDDGSPDTCPQICDTYAEMDARIKVIHKQNGGLSDARNTGLEIASGDWIAFVDSDDYMEPTMLQSLYDAAIEQGADISVCNALFFNGSETWTPDWFSVKCGQLNGMEILKSGRIPTALVVAWNKLYRRKIFATLRYPVGRIHEDEAIAHEVLGLCGKIVCIDKKLYYYRQNPEGITKKAFSAKRLDVILAMADRVMYYQKNGLNEWIGPVLNDFWWHLMDKYYRVELNRENKEKHIACLRAVRAILPAVICNKEIVMIEKVRYVLFCVSPRIHICLRKCSG